MIGFQRVGSIAERLRERSDLRTFLRRKIEKVEIVRSPSLAERIDLVPDAVKKSGGNLAVFIVDSPELPGVLVAPESQWAIVNVARYEGETQSVRVGRELARAVVMVGGGFSDGFANSLLGPITDKRQLDGFKSARISFDVAGRMVNYLEPLGVRPFQCDGWYRP